MRNLIIGFVFLALSLAAAWSTNAVVSSYVSSTPLVEREMSVDQYIHFLAKLNRVNERLARAIIGCESHDNPEAAHHNFHGKVEWSRDVGYFQLNNVYQQAAMAAKGWDIYKPEDNLQAGFYILKTQGSAPWTWSKWCWSKK